MSSIDLKSLFEESRYPTGWAALTLLLYSPVGLVLAVLRMFIAFQALVAAAVLPELSAVRRFVLRSMCIVLGIIVKEENIFQRNETARLIVSNHVTPCDHLAIHVLSSCVTPCTWGQPAPFFRVLGVRDLGLMQGAQIVVTTIRDHLSNHPTPVLVFPEGSTTSGKTGLLKFVSWPFMVGGIVQPVVLNIWRPWLTQVAPTALGTTFWADIFWFLFSPCTVFTARYLQTMQQEENETEVQFGSRVQDAMAESLEVAPTKHTAADKAELEKRFLLDQSRPVRVSVSPVPTVSSELQRMARQVRDVLPHVPHDVIVRDLSRTRSVDITIANILEGHIQFTPLASSLQPAVSPIPSSSTVVVSPASVASPAALTASAQSVPATASCLDTSAPNFPRSAQERMLSFQERKARLLENARQKYIEKHGLNC